MTPKRRKSDFIVRRYREEYFIYGLFIFAFIGVYFFVDFFSRNPNFDTFFLAGIAFIFALIAWLAIYVIHRTNKKVAAAEFYNAIFAGSIKLNTKFFLILNALGEVEYSSPETREFFNNYDVSLDIILKYGNIKEKDNILEAIENGQSIKLPYNHDGTGDLFLKIDPLTRPKGFFTLRVEFERQKSKQNFPVLIQYSPIAIGLIDKDGTVVISNQSLRDFVSKRNDEKWNLFSIIDEGQKEVVRSLIKKNQDYEWIDIKLKNTEYDTAALLIHPVNSEENTIVKHAFYLMDNSRQKSIETKMANSQKMQAIGLLAGGIAHDFNNLLTAMIGFCDLLLKRHPPGDGSFADITQIKQNALRAARLTRQLLAFSRKQTLQAKIINITDILAEISDLIRRVIGENTYLEMIHGHDLKYAKVDSGELEQVILNLAINGSDSMPDGGQITIETSNFLVSNDKELNLGFTVDDEPIPDGEYVKISVSDEGTGIPKHIISKVFEPFFSTKGSSGTGLGLATVYGIIKQTKGYIFIDTAEGKGTTFNILFKAYDETERAEENPEKEIKKDLTGKSTLLLVEDEIPVRMVTSRALSNKGYNVLEAENGEEAIKLFQQEGDKIELVVTDVMMPGMTGPVMVKQIKAEHPDIKVIFISGYAEDAFADHFEQGEKFNFLSKPFTLDQLAEKVKEVLS